MVYRSYLLAALDRKEQLKATAHASVVGLRDNDQYRVVFPRSVTRKGVRILLRHLICDTSQPTPRHPGLSPVRASFSDVFHRGFALLREEPNRVS
jgi:hypothetical protein